MKDPVYKMQRLEVSGAVRPIYGSLGVKWLIWIVLTQRYYQLAHSSSGGGGRGGLGEMEKLRNATITFVVSVCQSVWNNAVSTEGIFMKCAIWIFSRKSLEKIHASLKSGENNGYFTWRLMYTEWPPKKCVHSLLINIFGINLNEISISGWECNIMFSQQMAQALL